MSSTPKFDIVIPIGPNDINYVWKFIKRNSENIIGYRNIYIVTKDPATLPESTQATARENGYIFIDEAIFPFHMSDIIELHGASFRNGWYLQQLLKLYAGFVIPDILQRYLVVDADIVFFRPVTFISEDNKYLLNFGREYHMPYFDHMKRMHPSLKRTFPEYSGICHHMLFDSVIVKAMMNLVEEYHGGGKPFWRLFLECVTDITGSGASEYEMYFNYVQQYHNDLFKIRPLKWANVYRLVEPSDYDYISVPHYMRT